MVKRKRVRWTLRAQKDREQILEYWSERNSSDTYPLKLNTLFKEATQLIRTHPQIGRPTDIHNVRMKIVRDYLMFYEISEEVIFILTLWDSRRDPRSLDI